MAANSGALRHFVEVAAWVPLPDARWQLAWTLAEIADKQVITVAEGALTTIIGETRRPTRWCGSASW